MNGPQFLKQFQLANTVYWKTYCLVFKGLKQHHKTVYMKEVDAGTSNSGKKKTKKMAVFSHVQDQRLIHAFNAKLAKSKVSEGGWTETCTFF